MDLISKRYSDPCFFMDGMIDTGRFTEFVTEFVKTHNKEREEKTEWEYFLHRVFDKSFADFREEMRTDSRNQNMSKMTIEATVQNSMDILKNFNPNERGET